MHIGYECSFECGRAAWMRILSPFVHGNHMDVQKKHWLIKSCADRNMYRVRILFSLSVFFFFTILYDAGSLVNT